MSSIVKLAAGAALATSFLAATASPSFAVNERVTTQVNHYVECLSLLLTDPQEHARVCGGTPMVLSLSSIASPGSQSGPAAAPPVVVTENPENCWPKGGYHETYRKREERQSYSSYSNDDHEGSNRRRSRH